MNCAFDIIYPKQSESCVVFASPHSGRDYMPGFLEKSVLDERAIRSSEDAFVDDLFSAAPQFGAVLFRALAPRAFIDLNRAADELDPAVIEGIKTAGQSPRINSGLGVIPRVVANGRSIYHGKLSLSEAQARIENYWVPYHENLKAVLQSIHLGHGKAVLLDCHSMPHEAMDSVVAPGMRRPEVVLGDRFGASASDDVVSYVEQAFKDAGFSVVRNTPFAGAYIAQVYGRPARDQHCIQIEIDRSIYMDEKLVEPNDNYQAIKTILTNVIDQITRIGQTQMPLVAE